MRRWGWRPGRRAAGVGMLVAAGAAATATPVAALAGAPDVAAYVPLPGVLALTAVVLAAAGAGLVRRPGEQGRAVLRVLSRWWVLAGAVLVAVSVWGTTALLLSLADTAPDAARRVELRLDAVKTGLTVGAGAAGLVALLLGVRRQWLGERTQAHQEYDAAEKRVTELYIGATGQLGHERAAVRLAGLYALERVAQDNPEHRQTVVDVICGYLRMPPWAGPAEPAGEERETDPSVDPQELQVRVTAQRILGEHLRWSGSEPVLPARFWPGIDLDLTGARLVKLDLGDCRMRRAGFGGAVFEGGARFEGALFAERAVFGGAGFAVSGPAGNVSGAARSASGREGNVSGPAGYGDRAATFRNARFAREAVFRDAVFAVRANFAGTTFEGAALFGGADFEDRATFRGAVFAEAALFGGAAFTGEAVFRQVTFEGAAFFGTATFRTGPSFAEARARTVPGTQRSWPGGWDEAVDDGSDIARLVEGGSLPVPPAP
ncbi:pentapeptide repeat-containing protein [Streptosporangium sp. NPDC050855]|uniref:pentapeptide repeat-containing protein n=1 Tax=Streptosporangium sp. NPDC050855 TaxID=3366194 RepID=UPI0037A7EBCC